MGGDVWEVRETSVLKISPGLWSQWLTNTILFLNILQLIHCILPMYCIKYTYIQYNLLCIFCKLHQSQSLLAAVCYGECPLEGFFITAQLHFLQGPTTARVLGTCPVTTGAYVSCNLTHTQVYTHTTTRRQQFPLITVESVTREFESHFVFSMSDVFYRQIQSADNN